MVTFISFSDLRGGAAKAAFRIFSGLEQAGIKINYVVAEKKSSHEFVKGPVFLSEVWHLTLRLISYTLLRVMSTKNRAKHSLNIFSSPFVLKEASKAKTLHLHWINNDTISIRALAKLAVGRKVIITLHDEWIYCGAEHCFPFEGEERFINGYYKNNSDVKGMDLNRYIWNLKRVQYRYFDDVIFTVPSKWLYDRAKASYLLSDKQILLIPNPIPIGIFKPKGIISFDKIARDEFIIVFGAVNVENNPLKGGELLFEALEILSKKLNLNEKEKIKILMFGGDTSESETSGFKTIGLGKISSEYEMADIYNMGTVTVVPSLVESFGQVAAESLACSTPVVAFNSSGIKDIVQHKKSGFLAEPYKSESLAAGILWFFNSKREEIQAMGNFGRQYVETNFSTDVVTNQYKALYHEVGNNEY